ncbi:MAG: cupin domain-containing protein [Gloeomargarita sp. GMQP_bins_44]
MLTTPGGIQVKRQISKTEQEALGITSWPIWEKGVSEFPWTYDTQETCYFLAGEVTVTPVQGEPVTIKAGDLAVFPKGLQCTWKITQPVRKHYRFD